MEPTQGEQTLALLRELHKRAVDVSRDVLFNKKHAQHTHVLALYGSLLELSSNLILLTKDGPKTGIPVILRSCLEAYVNLINLCKDAAFGYHLEVRAAMEAQKFIREALAGAHKDLRLPAPPEEMRTQLARQEALQKGAEAKGGKNMHIKDKFEAIGMISDYYGVYADLCSQSHHTLPALRARHFEKKGNGVSITYYRLTNLDEVEPYVGYASALLVGATEHVHDLLNKPCPELVNSMRARLDNAAASHQDA